MAAGAVPIRDSVGAALRFARENLRFIATVAGIFAAVSTLLALITLSQPGLGIVTMVANGVVQAFCYGALTAAVLFGPGQVRQRAALDGWRVWSSMAVVAFFLFIVMFVIFMVVGMVLLAGPLAPYTAELQSAGADEQRVMAILTRIGQEQPGAILLAALFCGAIWLLLTSRLYLAAPASVEAGRILTFETWKWTQGAVLGISWARLMLLIPAYIFMFALTTLLGRLFGFNMLDAGSLQAAVSANPVGLIVFEFISSFLVSALYVSLEAGLSAYLYRGLKPAGAPAAQPPAAA
ncbi:MAG: hypothetical protein ABL889_21365 [Terricaulis sp.]